MERQTLATDASAVSAESAAVAEAPKRRKINRAVLSENLWGWFFVCFIIIGTTLFVYLALVLSIWMSFTSYNKSSGFTLWEALGKINGEGWYYAYKYLFSPMYNAAGQPTYTGISNDFWESLLNSVIYMIGIPVGMALSLFFAVLMSRDIKGSGVFRLIYYVPTISSTVSIAIMWSNLFGATGFLTELFDTRFMNGTPWMRKMTVVFMTTWKGLGGSILLLCAGLNGVNESYNEAASIDGANAWTIFWRIKLPQLWPTIFYCIVTSVIGGMQIFAEPQLLFGNYPVTGNQTSAGIEVTPFVGYIYGEYNANLSNYNYAVCSAMGVVLMFIIFFLTLIQFALDRRRDS